MSFRRCRNVELMPTMSKGVNSNQFKIINKFREQQDLPPLIAKSRNCLKCGGLFVSDHAGVRMCSKHAYKQEVMYESKIIFG